MVSIRANFQSSYLWRYLIMAIAGLFMALWFAFDGLVTYPKGLEYAEAYEQVAQNHTTEGERAKAWRELAASKGWPLEVPEKSARTIRNDIEGQYFFGVLSLLLGLPAAYLYWRSRGRWIESTEDGLVTSWGQRVRFADVQSLNKKRWDAKGIARATYIEGTSKRTFVFDDFKYDREALGQILRKLEAVLPEEKIVAGISEAQRDAQKALAQPNQNLSAASGEANSSSNDENSR
ncbi:MAG: hypothetical protein KF752_11185 [Pirellulaceae bacterium]|nr:hypothetical protein [Pirellulaceae bacterium]